MPLLAHSQIHKTYQGDFLKGKARYQYYEDADYNRIYDGSFNYSRVPAYVEMASIMGCKFYKATGVLAGIYKKGNKNGKWTYNEEISFSHYSLGKVEYVVACSTNFTNGNRSGLWTYNKTGTESRIINLNFKENEVIGQFKVTNNHITKENNTFIKANTTLSGTFDNEGKFIGKWMYNDNDNEIIADFTNNIITKLLVRSVKYGTVSIKYDDTEIVNWYLESGFSNPSYQLINFDELQHNGFYNNINIIYENVKSTIKEFDEPMLNTNKWGCYDYILAKPQVLVVK